MTEPTPTILIVAVGRYMPKFLHALTNFLDTQWNR